MRHRSGPVELCEKMLEMRHRSGPVELCAKNARINQMHHMSGFVELCVKMLEFIKSATGPDLWNYVKKS